jgi:NAD(P)-dependent dehydrogenase (short-subunit alcohol dehydrogenase family)
MALTGKTTVVLGGTGYVGEGAVYGHLSEGARVVVVSRSQAKIDTLFATFDEKFKSRLAAVEGDFRSEQEAQQTVERIQKAAGGPIHHVVSVLGFMDQAHGGPTQTSLDDFRAALDNGLVNTFLAAKYLLPLVREQEGSSYVILGGGLAHFSLNNASWLGTLKNGSIIPFFLSLVKEHEAEKVRINLFCVHFGISRVVGQPNQIGMAAIPTREVGPVFVEFATNPKARGLQVCGAGVEDTLQKVKRGPIGPVQQ